MVIFSGVTVLLGLYGLIKIIIDMIFGKKWIDIRKSHEFVALVLAMVFTFIILFPWGKIHWGESKIIVHDTIKDTVRPVTVQKNTGGYNSLGNDNNTGKNNFNGGTGNKYTKQVHVGDNIYEPQLVISEAKNVLRFLDSIRIKYKSNNKTFIMYVNSDSNLKTYSHQLKDFLVAHGYVFSAISSGEDSFNGITVEGYPDSFYVITIGDKVNGKPFPISIVNTH